MATWPITLPNPVVDGYQLAPVDQTVRTDMEVGLARVRRRTSARNDQITVAWKFTDAQMQTFRDWFDNASTGAAGGSAWFTVSLAVGETGLDSKEARFVGTWQADGLPGLLWTVSAKLEIR